MFQRAAQQKEEVVSKRHATFVTDILNGAGKESTATQRFHTVEVAIHNHQFKAYQEASALQDNIFLHLFTIIVDRNAQ